MDLLRAGTQLDSVPPPKDAAMESPRVSAWGSFLKPWAPGNVWEVRSEGGSSPQRTGAPRALLGTPLAGDECGKTRKLLSDPAALSARCERQ